MPNIQRVRVTMEFEVLSEEYLEAMQDVRIALNYFQEIQDELQAEDISEPRIVNYKIWAKEK